ncbi:MAG: Hsp33 family molecular chaperone HslO [Clostridia bacterium]|nr:Hsp33 family molecular chaperone HslO [Clostridia bacterium]
MTDYLVKAMAYDANVRAFAVTAKDTVYEALNRHGLNPVAAIALGRGLMAAAILNGMGKGDDIVTTLQINGDGPMEGMVCVADRKGTLKGYIKNNDYESYGENGIFGVGACIGRGYLNIIKDLGMKEPYAGTIPLQSGEIGDDLAYYFTYSEQIPSMVALGVKLNSDATVRQAAGVIIQMMPGATEEIITEVESRITEMKSATSLIERVKTPEAMLEFILGKENIVFTGTEPVSYQCNCSEEKMFKGVISLGRKELTEIVEEQDTVETVCHFCNNKYIFTAEQLKKFIKDI